MEAEETLVATMGPFRETDLSLSFTGHRRRRRSPKKNETTQFIETVSWVLGALEKDSNFFQRNPPRALPHLERSEIEIGKYLGQGEFGVVHEVEEFKVSDPCHCPVCLRQEETPPVQKLVITGMPPATATHRKRNESTGSRVSFADVPVTIEDVERIHNDRDDLDYSDDSDEDNIPADFEIREERGFMRAHCKRGELARYAVKRVRDNVPEIMKEDAAIDLATEAKFLASLTHPNIIKLRAVVGVPGHADFLMVMDRLYSTLSQNMIEWHKLEKKYRGVFGHFGRRQADLEHLRIDRMIALYDVARALKSLHQHNIVYRDLKPENIGFDVRGDAKLFDFGLTKELLPKDLVAPPDGYEASGMTGSRRYMAPEVILCKEYGLSADVYSYAILFWQVMALEMPFAKYNTDEHFTRVVMKGERPKKISFLSPMVALLLDDCWVGDRRARPGFKRICETLKAELCTIESSSREFTDRTTHLMDTSYSSRFGPS